MCVLCDCGMLINYYTCWLPLCSFVKWTHRTSKPLQQVIVVDSADNIHTFINTIEFSRSRTGYNPLQVVDAVMSQHHSGSIRPLPICTTTKKTYIFCYWNLYAIFVYALNVHLGVGLLRYNFVTIATYNGLSPVANDWGCIWWRRKA